MFELQEGQKIIGHGGDVNPFDYGGYVVIANPVDNRGFFSVDMVVIDVGNEEEDEPVQVYRYTVEQMLESEIIRDYRDLESISNCVDVPRKDLESWFNGILSDEEMQTLDGPGIVKRKQLNLSQAAVAVAGYWGHQRFDGEPDAMTREKAEEIYGYLWNVEVAK